MTLDLFPMPNAEGVLTVEVQTGRDLFWFQVASARSSRSSVSQPNLLLGRIVCRPAGIRKGARYRRIWKIYSDILVLSMQWFTISMVSLLTRSSSPITRLHGMETNEARCTSSARNDKYIHHWLNLPGWKE